MMYGNINSRWDLEVPIRVLDANEYVHRFEVRQGASARCTER